MGDPADELGREYDEVQRARGCPSCGRPNVLDSRFCAGCGHRFLGDDGEAEPEHPTADPLIGRTIADRYRIDQMIGRGGMGVVYRVEHVRIGKLMAMKLLHGELARDKDVVKRFRREAESVSKLDHSNTVQVFDFGRSEGLMYLVMELLAGKDLGVIVEAEGVLPFSRVARIGAQICGSVAQAHARGIVHRDLKPENVRVLSDRSEPDFVKVMDFGLAKLREGTEEAAAASITRAGFIVGTPYYMAPEHIRGDAVDPRTDVYALGALMYKCLTGVPPFWASTPVGVLTKHLTEPVVPPSVRSARRDVPPEADAIVLRAMAKDPRDRQQSMDELRGELAGWLRDRGESTGSFGSDHGVAKPSTPYEVTDSGRKVPIATRGDVDRYERGLQIQSWALNAMGVAIVAGMIAAGVVAWREWRSSADHVTSDVTSETEPNDVAAQANELPEARSMSGYLGRRMSSDRSDADVWMLRNPGHHERVVRIDFSGLPNMDTVLEIFRAGQSEPLLVIDGAGMGLPERVPNFVISDTTYLLRVRELYETGRHPTENVSDAYRLEWSYVEPAEGDEREVNDTFSLAEHIRLDEARRGYVGWNDDTDVFCVTADAPEVTAILEPVASLDLVLRVDEHVTGRSTIFDAGRVGEGERATVTGAVAGQTCFAISARAGQTHSDAEERWTLRVVTGGAAEGSTTDGVVTGGAEGVVTARGRGGEPASAPP